MVRNRRQAPIKSLPARCRGSVMVDTSQERHVVTQGKGQAIKPQYHTHSQGSAGKFLLRRSFYPHRCAKDDGALERGALNIGEDMVHAAFLQDGWLIGLVPTKRPGRRLRPGQLSLTYCQDLISSS